MKLFHCLKIILLFAFISLQMMSMEPKQEEKPTEFLFAAMGYYEQERQQLEEQNCLRGKYERLMRRIEALKRVKQAKYRKIQALMGQHIQTFGGAVKSGKGSGRRIELGGTHSGYHQPHGSNGTQIDRGALNSLANLMQGQNLALR